MRIPLHARPQSADVTGTHEVLDVPRVWPVTTLRRGR